MQANDTPDDVLARRLATCLGWMDIKQTPSRHLCGNHPSGDDWVPPFATSVDALLLAAREKGLRLVSISEPEKGRWNAMLQCERSDKYYGYGIYDTTPARALCKAMLAALEGQQ